MKILARFAFDTACFLAAGALAAYALGIPLNRGVALSVAYLFLCLGNAKWKPI